MSEICINCGGGADRGSCICALAEEIRTKFALFCPACDGKDVEHNHWITNMSYGHNNPYIQVFHIDLNSAKRKV